MTVATENGRRYFSSLNEKNCSNRYIFCENSDTYIMVGDLPVVRLVKRRVVLGSFAFFAATAEGEFPLHEAESIQALWRCGHSRWVIGDRRISGKIEIEVGNADGVHGLVLKLSAGENNVKLLYGGVHALLPKGVDMSGVWSIDPRHEGDYAKIPFNPEHGGNEIYTPVQGGFSVSDPSLELLDGKIAPKGTPLSLLLKADSPLRKEDRFITGVFSGDALIMLALRAEGQPLPAAGEMYTAMLQRADRLNSRLSVSTPVPLLDMACAYTAEYQNGVWYPPKTMHAPLSWNAPYLGWTNRYGTAVLGWHDRMDQELAYYADKFTLTEENSGGGADYEKHLGTIPAKNSRFYGRGHVYEDQHMYNMQTQFFDQAIYNWRMTGSEKTAELLYRALLMHMEWYDACFDRGGVYESVIDTWPTDTVWCAGGASSDATCYAYRAHEAIRELARHFGEEDTARRHEAICAKIKEAFFRLLWIPEKGHPGKFREQGGLKRLHENPWIYASFLPVDVNLLTPIEAAQTVHYARKALEHVPSGDGMLISGSNWVPSVWSVRWVGENEIYMQALAYFRAGFFEDGLSLLIGGVSAMGKVDSMAFLGSDGARCVLEGLFGYRPNYPNGSVVIAPGMPFAWENASVCTSDVSIQYSREETSVSLSGTLSKKANLTLRIPLYARGVKAVRGAKAWEIVPGFGCAFVEIALGCADAFHIEMETEEALAPLKAVEISCRPLSRVDLKTDGEILTVEDPQNISEGLVFDKDSLSFTMKNMSGEHMLFASVRRGENECVQPVYLSVSQTEEELLRDKKLHPALPDAPAFEILNAQALLRDDVQKIYKQEYLSPRPETVSVRIGTDGYSPWTFTFWKNRPPEIRLEKRGIVFTKDGVPLAVGEGDKNIGFVSRWDNYPESIVLPAGKTGKACAVLLAGTTNPMQCGVENVRLTFRYADGSEESAGLRNPDEFWSLTELAAAPSAAGQDTNNDYSYETDAFCLPEIPPETIQLGENCRAVVVRWALKEDAALESIRLTALSEEIVVGLMAATMIR